MRTPSLFSSRVPLLLLLLCPLLASAQEFRFTTLDIGQGDSAVLIAPGGCAVLFDGGPTGSGTTIKSYLKEMGVTRVDLAFISHMHVDHMGGIDEVDVGTDAVPITAVYDHGGNYNSKAYDEYVTHFAGRRFTATRGQTFSVCGQVTLKVVASHGNGVASDDENAQSVAVKVTYGAFDALVGGDLTATPDNIETTLLDELGELELYKVHHHGSRYSSSDALLDKTVPLVSFISVGRINTYGHPTRECLDRLTAHHSDIWQTEDPATNVERGHIRLRAAEGGATFQVTQGTTSVSYISRGGTQEGPDEVAPTAPRSLVAGALSPDSLELRWAAASDDRGVAGYVVYRNVAGYLGYTLAGTSTTLGFVDLGLAPGHSYTYTVQAFDAAGNLSEAVSTDARTPLPRITVTSPDGGESWGSGSARKITWNAIGYTRVDVDFSADNGTTWTSLATHLDATTASYAWTVPATLTTSGRVRVKDSAGRASGASHGPFAITTPPPLPRVIFNELLANEPGNATSGEFLELVNIGNAPADLGGWVLMDKDAVRHTFAAGTVLGAGKAIVVFGGASGIPAGTPNAIPSSTGTLSLNNGGDTVTIKTSAATDAVVVDTYAYTATQAARDGESINRSPDATAGSFVFHTVLATTASSPGTRVNGGAF